MKKLNGIIPVLITPLKEDKTVDEISLIKICKKYCNSNVKGLWVLGTGGEDMCLSFEDRLEVAEVVEIILANLEIILGCSFFSPKNL